VTSCVKKNQGSTIPFNPLILLVGANRFEKATSSNYHLKSRGKIPKKRLTARPRHEPCKVPSSADLQRIKFFKSCRPATRAGLQDIKKALELLFIRLPSPSLPVAFSSITALYFPTTIQIHSEGVHGE
jgi:hypothetical protein